MLSWSGGFEEGLEADAEILVVHEAVEQGDLVDEDGAEGEALGADEAARCHGAVDIEDAFELLIEVLNGHRAQLVKDPSHLDPIVGMRVGSTAGGNQETAGVEAVITPRLAEIRT